MTGSGSERRNRTCAASVRLRRSSASTGCGSGCGTRSQICSTLQWMAGLQARVVERKMPPLPLLRSGSQVSTVPESRSLKPDRDGCWCRSLGSRGLRSVPVIHFRLTCIPNSTPWMPCESMQNILASTVRYRRRSYTALKTLFITVYLCFPVLNATTRAVPLFAVASVLNQAAPAVVTTHHHDLKYKLQSFNLTHTQNAVTLAGIGTPSPRLQLVSAQTLSHAQLL